MNPHGNTCKNECLFYAKRWSAQLNKIGVNLGEPWDIYEKKKDYKRIMGLDIYSSHICVYMRHTRYTRLHTGGCMSCGFVLSMVSLQKIIWTKKSTETKLVPVSEYVSYKDQNDEHFIGKGYALHKYILYQDN